MAYVTKTALPQTYGRRELTGSFTIMLAEKAHNEGRLEEARGLVELAYRLFDDAADLVCPTSAECVDELHHA